MPRWVSTTLLVVLVALALWGMWRAWRGRVARTSAVVPELPAAPADGWGEPRSDAIEATYVSTTTAGDWLDRVAAHDLGVRSAAQVQVFAHGVRIARTGAQDVLVPAAAVRDARTAPGMAGKFVGGEGLVVVTWQAPGPAEGEPGALLDTGLRTRHAADREVLVAAVRGLVGGNDVVEPPAGAAPQEKEES